MSIHVKYTSRNEYSIYKIYNTNLFFLIIFCSVIHDRDVSRNTLISKSDSYESLMIHCRRSQASDLRTNIKIKSQFDSCNQMKAKKSNTS